MSARGPLPAECPPQPEGEGRWHELAHSPRRRDPTGAPERRSAPVSKGAAWGHQTYTSRGPEQLRLLSAEQMELLAVTIGDVTATDRPHWYSQLNTEAIARALYDAGQLGHYVHWTLARMGPNIDHDLSLNQQARRLGTDKRQLGRIVKRVEAEGWIERISSGPGRRATTVPGRFLLLFLSDDAERDVTCRIELLRGRIERDREQRTGVVTSGSPGVVTPQSPVGGDSGVTTLERGTGEGATEEPPTAADEPAPADIIAASPLFGDS